jgi:hypothetical protein
VKTIESDQAPHPAEFSARIHTQKVWLEGRLPASKTGLVPVVSRKTRVPAASRASIRLYRVIALPLEGALPVIRAESFVMLEMTGFAIFPGTRDGIWTVVETEGDRPL